MFVFWIIGALVMLAAAGVCVLVVHTRRDQRRDDAEASTRYAPNSADPRGRWQVSRFGDDLLETTPYVLNTDHDGPAWTPMPPPVRELPALRPRSEHRDGDIR